MQKFQLRRMYKLQLIVFCILCVSAYAQQVNIIPYPQEVTVQNGSFHLSSSTKIYYDAACKNEADFFLQVLNDEQQLKLSAHKKVGATIQPGNIYLNISAVDSGTLGREGYALHVDNNNI